MKHTLLTLALLTSLNANATGYDQSTNANAGAVALSGAISSATGGSASNGNTSAYVGGYDAEKNAVHSAIAPSQSVNNDCQIATPQSKAISVIFASISGTTGVTVNALCLAYRQGDKELTHQIACNTVPEYKKAVKQLGRECKD